MTTEDVKEFADFMSNMNRNLNNIINKFINKKLLDPDEMEFLESIYIKNYKQP